MQEAFLSETAGTVRYIQVVNMHGQGIWLGEQQTDYIHQQGCEKQANNNSITGFFFYACSLHHTIETTLIQDLPLLRAFQCQLSLYKVRHHSLKSDHSN